MSTMRRLGSALMLGLVLLAFVSPSISSPAKAAPLYMTLVEEDFESSVWPSEWTRGDSIPDSGSDYWGVSSYRAYTGTRSAWCAQIGTNSVNYASNSANHYYDQNMSSIMQIYLGNLTGYSLILLGFYYWAWTEVGSWGDWVEVRAWDGESWSMLARQPAYNSGGWQLGGAVVPNSTINLSIVFISDNYAVESPRPEGVYIDDLIIAALDDAPPESILGPIDYYHSSSEIFIPYAARDLAGSGVHHVELYCRHGDSGPYEKYTTDECEDGNWTLGYIPFNSTLLGGDGIYQFYLVAVDNLNNTEEANESSAIEIMIDTGPPTTSSNVTGTFGTGGWYVSEVMVEMSGEDNTSGIDAIYYSTDSGASWQAYTGEIVISDNGQHEISYYSRDQAGNRDMTHTLSFGIDTDDPELSVTCDTGDGVLEQDYIEIGLSCEDNTSGIDHIEVTRDGLITRYYSGSTESLNISGLSNGAHEIEIRAVDCAGNSVSTTISFEVDVTEESETTSSTGGTSMPLIALIAVIAAVISLIILMLTLRPKKRYGEKSEPTEDTDERQEEPPPPDD